VGDKRTEFMRQRLFNKKAIHQENNKQNNAVIKKRQATEKI
jgi:hypothetical protein